MSNNYDIIINGGIRATDQFKSECGKWFRFPLSMVGKSIGPLEYPVRRPKKNMPSPQEYLDPSKELVKEDIIKYIKENLSIYTDIDKEFRRIEIGLIMDGEQFGHVVEYY